MNLATLFERERNWLWAKLGEVADSHASLAPLLSREGDPRVGYLVDAAAYGMARLREVFSDDSPQETHTIVGTSMPEVLRPTPAMTVVRWAPAFALRSVGASRAAGQLLRSIPVPGGGKCEFQSLWPVEASPLSIVRTALQRREAGTQTLTIRFAVDEGTPVGQAFPASLRLFASGGDPLRALDIVHAVCTNASTRVNVLDGSGNLLSQQTRASLRVTPTLLAGNAPLLPGRRDAFGSHSLTRSYFAFPEAFAFFQLEGLREVLRSADPAGRTVEVVIALERPLDDEAGATTFHLHCVPCANIRSTTFQPMVFTGTLMPQRIAPQTLVGCEVFELESLRVTPAPNDDGCEELRMWHHDEGRVLLPDEVVGRVRRRAGPLGGITDCDLELVTLDASPLPKQLTVTVQATVTDGLRPERLLPGDVGSSGGDSPWVNITRVTPPFPVCLDRQIPWRANAYARITVGDFATPRALRGFLEVLDVTGRRARTQGASSGRGIDRVARRDFVRVVGDQVHRGDAVDAVLRPDAFGGLGATWVLGELLARALSERTDALRFSHLRWVASDGAVIADYGVRSGERFPFPFS